jgi:hypothetical protein
MHCKAMVEVTGKVNTPAYYDMAKLLLQKIL